MAGKTKASKFEHNKRMEEVYEYILQCRTKGEIISFIMSKGWFTTTRQAENLYRQSIELLHTNNTSDLEHDRALVKGNLVRLLQQAQSLNKGKLSNIHAQLKVLKQMCEMLGIDPPKRVEVTGKDGVDLNAGRMELDLTKLSDAALREIYEAGRNKQ